MVKIKRGATRWVFLIGPLAFKVPHLGSYRLFLYGLLANMQEVQWSRCHFNYHLCPIWFYLPFGFLVVMPKVAEAEDNSETWTRIETILAPNQYYELPVEKKLDSFGWYKQKFVVVDYGS